MAQGLTSPSPGGVEAGAPALLQHTLDFFIAWPDSYVQEAVFFRGCERLGLPVNSTKDILRDSFRPQENAILQPGGTAGRTEHPLFPAATGCTENPRLWRGSGLPDPNGWVGRGYTDHSIDWVIGVFDEYTGNLKGAASSARVDFPGRGAIEQVGLPPALQALSMGLSDSGVRGGYDNGRGPTGAWDGKAGRLVGAELKNVLSDVDRLVNMLVLTDDDVEPDNRVIRSVFPPDEHGPVPKVVFEHRRRTARTHHNREFLANRAAEILRAAGARTVLRMDFPPVPLHVHSTMRMGVAAEDSVLDQYAEARWVDRLFVGDNSALANALGGPNPTLTTQAVATRTAERIHSKYFDGALG